MELELLKQAWTELNQRVEKNELIRQEQIVKMLSSQKESNLQKMLRLEKMGAIVLLFLTVLISVLLIRNQMKTGIFLFVVIPLALAVIFNVLGFLKLKKIEKENNLEKQVKNSLQYKSLTNWAYIIIYLSVVPAIVLYLVEHATFASKIIVSVVILLGVLIDYFQYHYITDKVKEFSKINRELADLKNGEI